MDKITYEFTGSIWQHSPNGGWHFVSLPKDISQEIRNNLQWQEEGWGRMKAKAKIGDVEWDTAIWFDTKLDRYILPVKADIRRKLKLKLDQNIDVVVWV